MKTIAAFFVAASLFMTLAPSAAMATDPIVFLDCAWVYMKGQEPLIETPYGTSGAEG